MELLPILRLIWRRRILLGAGLVVSVALALGLGGPPKSSSALAWTRVNLDTPTSQLVNSAPGGADTLPWRASFLIHLMATDATQKRLAQSLHVRPDEVAVVDPALGVPIVPASIPTAASDAAGITVAPYVLTLTLTTRRSRRSRSRPQRPIAPGRNGSPPPRWPSWSRSRRCRPTASRRRS